MEQRGSVFPGKYANDRVFPKAGEMDAHAYTYTLTGRFLKLHLSLSSSEPSQLVLQHSQAIWFCIDLHYV